MILNIISHILDQNKKEYFHTFSRKMSKLESFFLFILMLQNTNDKILYYTVILKVQSYY